ncbi:MAG: PorV/PorQ family protein [Elusimicrobiota bacterium]
MTTKLPVRSSLAARHSGKIQTRTDLRSTEFFRLAACAVLLISPLITAQALGVGTTGAQFLKVGIGARPLAMAGAFSALAEDADAVYWNPGGLGEVKRKELSAGYNSLFQDQNQGFVTYASPLSEGRGVWAAGLDYLVVSNIEKRAGDTETPDSTFSNQNFALTGSYGSKTPIEGLSIGANVKYIRETLDTFSANAVAFDIGARYKTPIESLSVGGSMRNFGTKIGPDPLPLSFKGGAAYTLWNKKLTLASDFDWLANDQRSYWALGAEFWANKSIAVRAGYQFGHGQDQLQSRLVGAAFGAGLKLEHMRVDYAFLPFGELGDTHRLSLGWTF